MALQGLMKLLLGKSGQAMDDFAKQKPPLLNAMGAL
jgi:hypothetical protein